MATKRAQSAMEFLATYGWAILVLIVVIGVLFYLGVMNPAGAQAKACVFSVGLSCRAFALSSSNGMLQLDLGQATGGSILVTGVSCSENPNAPIQGFASGTMISSGESSWVAGGTSSHAVPCTDADGSPLRGERLQLGSRYAGRVCVRYVEISSGVERTFCGDIATSLEQVAAPTLLAFQPPKPPVCPGPGQREIASGGFVIYESGKYVVCNDITSTGGNGITIMSNGGETTLDCQGKYITGDGAGIGVSVDRTSSVTVTDCNVVNFGNGISVVESSDVAILDNSVTGNSNAGIVLASATDSRIEGNIVNSNLEGIILTGTTEGVELEANSVSLNTLSDVRCINPITIKSKGGNTVSSVSNPTVSSCIGVISLPVPSAGWITGNVVDWNTGMGITNATVDIVSGPGSGGNTTADNGAYAIYGLLPGTYVVEVNAYNYYPEMGNATVVSNYPSRLDFALEPSVNATPTPTEVGDMQVQVAYDSNPDPNLYVYTGIPNATVTAAGMNTSRTCYTGSDGLCKMYYLPLGTYSVTAQAAGYYGGSAVGNVIMPSPGFAGVSILLEPLNATPACIPDGQNCNATAAPCCSGYCQNGFVCGPMATPIPTPTPTPTPAPPACAAGGVISSCPCTINVSGSYTLGSNLASTGTCITISPTAGGTTLDCQGRTLAGSSTGSAILVSGAANVNVRNCVIKSFYDGIYVSNSSGGQISGNSISGFGRWGVYLYASRKDITSNSISGGTLGIYLRLSVNNTIASNTVANCSERGMLIGGNYNYVSSNALSSNGMQGILIEGSYNAFSGNTVCSSGLYDFYCAAGANNAGANKYDTNYGCTGITKSAACTSTTPTPTPMPTPTPTPTPTPKGWFSGIVRNANGSALSGAAVTAIGAGNGTNTTDVSGFYYIYNLLPGTYNLTASKSGYQSNYTTGRIVAGAATGKNFTLYPVATPTPTPTPAPTPTPTPTPTPRGWFYGRVTNINGSGLSGAAVNVTGPSAAANSTDASGYYYIYNLLAGTYNITAGKSGYVTNYSSGTIYSGNQTLKNFQLNPVATPTPTPTPAPTPTPTPTPTPRGWFYGRVVNLNGTGLAGAVVNVSGTSVGANVTDAGGFYYVYNLLVGNYTLIASKSGYAINATGGFISAGVGTSKNFTLR